MALVSPTRTTDTTAQEPLLNHALTTNPDPIKASPENPAEPEVTGELIITLSPKFGPVDVERIKVHVPAGTMASELATNLPAANARISLDGWTPNRDDSADEFEFIPTATYDTIDPGTGITIQISQIPISRKVGTAPITVTESSREAGKGAFHDRATTFNVGKFPPAFYMRNFIADPLVIDNGGEITLTWERSTNATYELLYGDTNLNVTNETTRTITNIKSDTTFYLRGTTSDDPNNPAVRILTAQVTVKKPDLEVRNLTVRGNVKAFNNVTVVEGNLHVGRGELMVNGAVRAYGTITAKNELHVDGNINANKELRVDGNINANGDVTIAHKKKLKVTSIMDSGGNYTLFGLSGGLIQMNEQVYVHKSLTVQQDHSINVQQIHPAQNGGRIEVHGPLNANGPLSVTGLLNATGPVSMAGSPALLPAYQSSYRTFSAGTSGLVIGVANVTNAGYRGTVYVATGGRETHSRWEHPGSATVVALVQKGQNFTIGPSGPAYSTTCEFYWLPFGAGSAIPASLNDAEQLAERADGAQSPQTDTGAET
ncbi:hypothetical protein [Streptomyces sp. NPDC004296]|uniref:hypothetical protein n=1 Tax=Streptomyces sp. NPDC004296 TaxID=3364697 RepID=UPI0036CEBDE1